MQKTAADDLKKREVQLIKIAQRQLNMDDATYRAVLFAVARVHSATELDWAGRQRVLEHMKKCGFKVKANRHRRQAPRKLDRSELMQKIEAQLADAQRPWAYAKSMAKRMFSVDDLEFCTPEHLHKMVAALEYDARRRAKEAK
jgi:phage gp16-like protein